jgi:hypothetical protein
MALESFAGFRTTLLHIPVFILGPNSIWCECPNIGWVLKIETSNLGPDWGNVDTDLKLVVVWVAFVGKKSSGEVEFESRCADFLPGI